MWKDSKVIFVTGKGGVGKSIVAAALARSIKDKKVLLVETDTYSIFDGKSNTSQTLEIKNRGNISTTNLSPQACLSATLEKYLPSRRIVGAITGNRVTRSFFDSAPSVNEFVLLDQIYEFSKSKDWDHIVVDLPATGHALTFLAVPKTLAKMMRGVGPIGKTAIALDESIMDQKLTSILAVSLPEEMPVNETIDLHFSLQEKLGRGLDRIILNMVNQSPVEEKDLERLREFTFKGDEVSDFRTFISANQIAADWASRDAEYVLKLQNSLALPLVQIPMFYISQDLILCEKIAGLL